MSIDAETARRVAHLARIEVAEADIAPLAAEFTSRCVPGATTDACC